MGNSPPNPCKKDPEGYNRRREQQIELNKKGRYSSNYRIIGKPCPTFPPINIPQFEYPKHILEYILSQTRDFRITYIPPGGSNPVDLKVPTATPYMDEEDDLDGTLSGWKNISLLPLGSPLDYETVPPISTPTSTPTPTIYIQPAYSEPTHTPTTPPAVTIPPIPPISPRTPLIWEAAINAMRYIKGLNLPITKNEQIYTLYIDLQNNILALLNGTQDDGEKNAAALIYFCTVITEAFKPFNEFISYNFLNGKYPEVFPDSKAYRKFCMINYYSIQASKLFNKNTVLKTYIPVNNRMMKYMVPSVLNSVIYQLQI